MQEAARLATRVIELTPSKQESEAREAELRARLAGEKAAREQAETALAAAVQERDAAQRAAKRASDEATDVRARCEQRVIDAEQAAAAKVQATQADVERQQVGLVSLMCARALILPHQCSERRRN